MSRHEQDAALERMNFYGDRRVIASYEQQRVTVVRENGDGTVVVLVELDEDNGENDENDESDTGENAGNGIEYTLRVDFIVCPLCRGRGYVVDPAIDCDGISDDYLRENPNFAESYHNGEFNIKCTKCEGKRVVLDLDKVRSLLPKSVRKQLAAAEREDREFLSVQLAELRSGA